MLYDLAGMSMKRVKTNRPFHEEELKSCIEIQQRSLQAYSREIYDNIGQVLSLVKLQLQSLQSDEQPNLDEVLYSGKLVGKAIADLRNLTKQLTPEEVVTNGFVNSIIIELKRLSEAGLCISKFSVKGVSINLENVKQLVVFCILQQLIYPTLNVYFPGNIELNMKYLKNKIEINITRKFGKEPLFLNIEEIARVKHRLKTIDSTINYKHQNWNTLQITVNT
jgi:hypothetical protein